MGFLVDELLVVIVVVIDNGLLLSRIAKYGDRLTSFPC